MGTRPLKNLAEVAVIGGGLAGLSAARHAARLGHLVTLFEGSGLYGGQVATVGHVEGLPTPGEHSGQELAMALLEQAQIRAVRVIEAEIAALDLGDRLTLTDAEGRPYHPDAVIVASGASLRKLGVPGEDSFAGRGVSRCATCDGGFYRGKDVAVIGGGDAAVHEALTLAPIVGTVTMVCRSAVRAQREYVDRLDARENVRFVWDCEVEAIVGNGSVAGVDLRNVRNGQKGTLACAGVFPFVGVEPNTGFVPAGLRGPGGHVVTDADLATTDRRVFAVGAARADYGGTALQAMAEGTSAAAAVHRLLAK